MDSRLAARFAHEPAASAPSLAPLVRATSHDIEGAHVCALRCRELLSDRGDVPGARVARDVMSVFGSLSASGRALFLNTLAQEFGADPEAVGRAAQRYLQTATDVTLLELQRASEAPRQELFLRLYADSAGTPFLVGLRERVLSDLPRHSSWTGVEADLLRVLRTVFNRGHLTFQRIDDRAPTHLLDKLIRYEAVHEVRGWDDLRRRLATDRRCYGFFHPAWPDEPIIFCELALTHGLAGSVRRLLDPGAVVLDAAACDSAIFYSITNCQKGLAGLSLGNALIGRVMTELGTELPGLKTFATLSPIPGFRPWLSALGESADAPPRLIALVAQINQPAWFEDARVCAELKPDLLPLCARYLLCAKRGVEPADPVARFHFANGARLRRVNWLSDLSPAGLHRSAGLTANYVYAPADLEGNCRAYATEHRVSASRRLERLSQQAVGARRTPSRIPGARPPGAAMSA
jgi:malonyl-CoA decarboxylase